MTTTTKWTRRGQAILNELLDGLDIPTSLYERAESRYRSLAEWLDRRESGLSAAGCRIYPQGSFRLGTVVRPLSQAEEYDLDLVCSLEFAKEDVSQREIKGMVGEQLRAYASAEAIKKPVSEKKRCWRLDYADEVSFHIDVLPAIPDDESFIQSLVKAGVQTHLAQHAVAITDMESPGFATPGGEWPRSNPKGFAGWFESRMKSAAQAHLEELVRASVYRSVDDVPAYRWKTPLQKAIQILKRHRDVMFEESRDIAPISVIITTVAAHSYSGDSDVPSALDSIVAGMVDFVRTTAPFVPNPVDPREDFADAWSDDSGLRDAFFGWHAQLSADLGNIGELEGPEDLTEFMKNRFNVKLSSRRSQEILGAKAEPTSPKRSREPIRIPADSPRPWGVK